MSAYEAEGTCQSFNRDGNVCKDGFIQKPFCRGHGACYACGETAGRNLPWCMAEDIPARFIKDDGSPAFYGQDRR